MAWGDLRFDHSDIFGEPVDLTKKVVGIDKRVIGRQRRVQVLELLQKHSELTRVQIRKLCGLNHDNGSLNALLKRLEREGMIEAFRGSNPGPMRSYRLISRRLTLR